MAFDSVRIQNLITELLICIEGDPIRPPLLETPRRVASALEEILDGYAVDIPNLFKTFEGEGQDQIVVVKDICSYSICEHHVLPFYIRASVAYLPVEKVIGASKIERVVNAYAHRLQLQERIARQVADSIMKYLQPRGVGVIIEGEHLCMRCRGVKSRESKMVNSVMLGDFRTEGSLRMEVLSLLGATR